jgi:hypothetical protein
LAATSIAPPAFANSGGLAGYSGKPNATAPAGQSCNQCHSGGTAPTVALSGPATLAAGQSAEYTLTVKTGQSRAAAGIAATDGVVLTPISALRDSFGELVQDAPVVVSNGQATFRFRVTAPTAGGPLRLWAVGLASDGSGAAGDRASQTTRDVTVTGGASGASDAGARGSNASGANSSSSGPSPSAPGVDAGSTRSKTTPGDAPDEDQAGSDDDESTGNTRQRSSSPTEASCAYARTPSRGDTAVAIACAALVLLGRERRRNNHDEDP